MTRRASVRIVLAASLTVVACLLAALAVLVWRVPASARRQDAQLVRPGGPGTAWRGSGGVAVALLGALDDASFRHGVSLFVQATSRYDPAARLTAQAVIASTEASVALGRVENGRSARGLRSRAANLDAVLVGQGAEIDGDVPALDHAAELLRLAIRLDRSNDPAKANLERLLGRAGGGSSLGRDATTGSLGGKPGGGVSGEGY